MAAGQTEFNFFSGKQDWEKPLKTTFKPSDLSEHANAEEPEVILEITAIWLQSLPVLYEYENDVRRAYYKKSDEELSVWFRTTWDALIASLLEFGVKSSDVTPELFYRTANPLRKIILLRIQLSDQFEDRFEEIRLHVKNYLKDQTQKAQPYGEISFALELNRVQ